MWCIYMYVHTSGVTASGEVYLMLLQGVILTDTRYVQSNIICLRYRIHGLCLYIALISCISALHRSQMTICRIGYWNGCGVVWCGVVWCGVVWCGVVWCGVVWCGMVCSFSRARL